MIKNILVGIFILGVIGVAVMGYSTYKIANEALKEKEPQLRQYMALDEAAQNKYVLEHIDELLTQVDLDKDGKPEDKEKIELLKKLNTQPDIQNALADAGRSFMAKAIMLSDHIVKDMSADVKAKYEKEAGQLEARFEKYGKLAEAAEPRLADEK